MTRDMKRHWLRWRRAGRSGLSLWHWTETGGGWTHCGKELYAGDTITCGHQYTPPLDEFPPAAFCRVCLRAWQGWEAIAKSRRSKRP